MALLVLLAACSPRHLILQGVASELAVQGNVPEEDLGLARDAGAFYLKLSESVLRETPGNLPLATAVAAGFTQYAYAFVQFEAERLEAKDAQVAQKLRKRAAGLYRRAHDHVMAALEYQTPGFATALASNLSTDWPRIRPDQVDLVYWAAASWGAWIAMSKDEPEVVADLPLAIRLARLAWDAEPGYGAGSLASLMGSFEAARPGGSSTHASGYFDQAITLGAGKNAGPLVGKAESIALPAGDRVAFEALLRQALAVSAAHHDLQGRVLGERALWLLETADDLF